MNSNMFLEVLYFLDILDFLDIFDRRAVENQ